MYRFQEVRCQTIFHDLIEIFHIDKHNQSSHNHQGQLYFKHFSYKLFSKHVSVVTVLVVVSVFSLRNTKENKASRVDLQTTSLNFLTFLHFLTGRKLTLQTVSFPYDPIHTITGSIQNTEVHYL